MKQIFLFVNLLLLGACDTKNVQEQKNTSSAGNLVRLTPAQYQSAGVQLGKVEVKNISVTIKVNGKIDVPPQNMISVSIPLGGYLKTTKLLPGMHIRKGEVIATIEDIQYIQLQQDYLAAKAKLIYLEAEYIRQKELNETKSSSDKVAQQTQMEFTMQKINVSALAEKLKLINVEVTNLSENNLSKAVNIYSPIDGFVSRVNVNIGKYVNASDILFELVNPSDIHLNLKVFEKDIEKLFVGQKLIAYNNNEPNKKHPCEIILISQYISSDRTAEVHCHFEDYDKTLLPGMYMNADIEVQAKTENAVKNLAIVNYDNKDYVFTTKDSAVFEMTEIKKGVSENNFTEISFLDKTKNNEIKIVTTGAYSLLMKMKNRQEE